MFSNLELRVIATLAYSNQFEFPLTTAEVCHRLVSTRVVTEEGWVGQSSAVGVNRERVTQVLQRLHQQGVVESNGEYWVLQGEKNSFAKRVSATRYTQKKAPIIQQLVKTLSRIVWIEALFITGSVAAQNAQQEDDVDVLVVTQPRRLWITRLVVLSVALVMGRRVKSSHQEGSDWCFNLWLENDHVAVPVAKRSLYEAYEIIQARCVWSRAAGYRHWLEQNRWVADFVPIGYKQLWQQANQTAVDEKKEPAFSLTDTFGDIANWLAYTVQSGYRWMRYAEKPKAFEAAFFHSATTKQTIYSQWRAKVNQVYQPDPMRTTLARRPRKYL